MKRLRSGASAENLTHVPLGKLRSANKHIRLPVDAKTKVKKTMKNHSTSNSTLVEKNKAQPCSTSLRTKVGPSKVTRNVISNRKAIKTTMLTECDEITKCSKTGILPQTKVSLIWHSWSINT